MVILLLQKPLLDRPVRLLLLLRLDPGLTDVQATVDVLEAVIRRDSEDLAINRIGRSNYLNIPTKTTQARPTQFYVNRQITPTDYAVAKFQKIPQINLIYYRV